MTTFPTDDEREVAYRAPLTFRSGGSEARVNEVLDALAPLIRAREAAAKAQALIDFADSTRFPSDWILFRRDDGSGVTVSDLLRETAANYRREADDD